MWVSVCVNMSVRVCECVMYESVLPEFVRE